MLDKEESPQKSEYTSSTGCLYQSTAAVEPHESLHFENKAVDNVNSKNVHTNKGTKRALLFFKNIFDSTKLEIVAFLFTFSYVLTRISSTSMILEKVCIHHFEYPEEICDNLEDYAEIKVSVERLSTNYQLGHTLIQTTPAAVLSCFVGPWTDRYGRKLPVTIAISGMILDTLGSAICAYYLDSRVEYYYIPAVFSGIFGGAVTCLAVVYSYASDMTPLSHRTIKYAFIEIASGIAQPMGAAAGGWIYNFFGYVPVFLLSTCGLSACLIWIIFLLPETRGMDNSDTWHLKIKNLFSCETFKESFKATAKERPQKGRRQIVLLIVSMCFLVIATNSTADISYLYVHHQFNWGNTKYSSITSIYSICGIFLLFIVFPLFRRCKVGDPTLGLIGTTSTILKYIGIGVAWKEAVFHIANLLGLLSLCAPLAARSRISKVVANEDLGKVFSFVATAESLLPVLTTVFVSQMFNAFISIYPGVPYIILSVFLIIPFSVFSWLICLPILNYEDMHGKSEKDRESYTAIET